MPELVAILVIFTAAGFLGWAACEWRLSRTRERLDAALTAAADLQRRLDWEAQRDHTTGAARRIK